MKNNFPNPMSRDSLIKSGFGKGDVLDEAVRLSELPRVTIFMMNFVRSHPKIFLKSKKYGKLASLILDSKGEVSV